MQSLLDKLLIACVVLTSFGHAFGSVCSVDKISGQYLVYTKAKQKVIMIEYGD